MLRENKTGGEWFIFYSMKLAPNSTFRYEGSRAKTKFVYPSWKTRKGAIEWAKKNFGPDSFIRKMLKNKVIEVTNVYVGTVHHPTDTPLHVFIDKEQQKFDQEERQKVMKEVKQSVDLYDKMLSCVEAGDPEYIAFGAWESSTVLCMITNGDFRRRILRRWRTMEKKRVAQLGREVIGFLEQKMEER
jgi:hypothetical protein